MKTKEYDERFAYFTPEKDKEYLIRTFEIAMEAREAGNNPFGALLVNKEGKIILEQPNIEVMEHDRTAHAETSLARAASKKFSPEELWDCSLYTNFEPCCMCTGAIYWTNIGRIVFAVSESDLLATTGSDEKNPTFNHNCRDILSTGQKAIVVNGPYPELMEQALESHKGFWN